MVFVIIYKIQRKPDIIGLIDKIKEIVKRLQNEN